MIRGVLILLILSMSVMPAMAVEVELHKKVTYKPTYELSVGYRLMDVQDSFNTIEYLSEEDSLALKADIEVYPLPHRFHFQGSYITDKEYYIDTGYAYSDLLLSRYIGVGFVHNEDPYRMTTEELSPELSTYVIRSLDAYRLNTSKHDFFLRLKYPDYPFHLFIKFRQYHHSGQRQQRYMVGYFLPSIQKYSTVRALKSSTNEVELGANAHLGPVEMEYFHTEKRVNFSGQLVYYDYYPEIYDTPADVYPHNMLSEFKASSDFFKIHTSYTGRIVASVSAKTSRNTNRYSGAHANMGYYSATFSYIFHPRLSLFVRAYYMQKEYDDIESVELYGKEHTVSYHVRPTPDSIKKKLTINLRYRPYKNTGIIAEYSIKQRRLSEVQQWPVLQESTTIQRFSMRLYTRLVKSFPLRMEFSHTVYRNPLYNSEPDHSERFKMQLMYRPTDWFSATAMYNYLSKDRERLVYYDGRLDEIFELSTSRRAYHHNTSIILNFIPSKRFTINTTFGYIRDAVKGPLMFALFTGDGTITFKDPYIMSSVPYSNEAFIYSIGVDWKYNDRITLTTEFSRTVSTGGLRTEGQFQELQEYSKLKTRQSELSIKGCFYVSKGVSIEPELLYRKYHDVVVEENSGEAYQFITYLKKSFD